MDNYKRISVDDLVALILEYADSDKTQDRPVIVWFDNVEADILKYSPHSDPAGFASALSRSNNKIAFYEKAGSPLTDHDHVGDGNGGVRRLSDEERMKFAIPSDVIRQGITKVFIHAPYICYIGEKGLTSLEYGVMVHNELSMPVFIMYPHSWKERIKADISHYDEYLCSASDEDVKARWFERASKKYKNGFQVVDNFYLEFLKQAPEKFVSYRFDPYGRDGVTFCDYGRWEYASKQLPYSVAKIINPRYGWGEELSEGQLVQFRSVFKKGNLDLNALESVLDTISDEDWTKWVEENKFSLKYNPAISLENPRIDVIKTYLCCDFGIMGNMPQEALLSLMKFHGLLQ